MKRYWPSALAVANGCGAPGLRLFSAKIGLRDVLQHHALRVEKRAVERDGMPHDVDELLAVPWELQYRRTLQAGERPGVALR